MKKFLICIMCAIMLVSSFACKNSGNETQSPEQTLAPTQTPTQDATQEPDATDEPTAEPVTVIPTDKYLFNEQTGEFEDEHISFVLPEGLTSIATSVAEPVYTYTFLPDNYPENSDSIVYIITPASDESDYSNKTLDELVKELEDGFAAMEMECSIENATLDTVGYGDEYMAIIFNYDITMDGMTMHQILWSITMSDYSINITSTTLGDYTAHLDCVKSVKLK